MAGKTKYFKGLPVGPRPAGASPRPAQTLISVLVLIYVLLPAAVPCRGCFSIVVGKNASADGYVIVGHNEDDPAPQTVNHHKVPRRRHPPGAKVRLRNGGVLEQAEQTWAYIWSEMPGMLYSDSYVNEWSVTVTSDNCPSRQDKPDITDGGIGYMLRRLVAERARTARQGVLLAGKLVERFGYADSGRTYIICDPEEGWLFCAVNGKHWLAQRVGDDEVAMVANTYTIRKVVLSDKRNFLACKDIVDYAKLRSWYDPKVDGPFDFAAVYAHPDAASHPNNFGRQWTGLKYISGEPLPLDPGLPFSVVPRRKLRVADVMQILRHDNQMQVGSTSSHLSDLRDRGCALCNVSTQTSFVTQLRRNVPLDIGIVYWVCLASPRTSFYIPFHFGISGLPAGFRSESERPTEQFYDRKVGAPFAVDPMYAFWTFSNFRDKVDRAGSKMVTMTKAEARRIEEIAFDVQKPLEKAACKLYDGDRTKAMRMLENYSKGIYLSCVEAMSTVLSRN
jgi:dipeptidase